MRFEQGNQIGRRWQPGQSGNPAGRPPNDPLKSAIMARLDAEPDLPERLVAAGIERALAGDFRYWKELFDRIDGKVPTLMAEPEPDLPVIPWSQLDGKVRDVLPPESYVIDYDNPESDDPESFA